MLSVTRRDNTISRSELSCRHIAMFSPRVGSTTDVRGAMQHQRELSENSEESFRSGRNNGKLLSSNETSFYQSHSKIGDKIVKMKHHNLKMVFPTV